MSKTVLESGELVFRAAPAQVEAIIVNISKITRERLYGEMGMCEHPLGCFLAPEWGEFPRWLVEEIVKSGIPALIGSISEPLWSDDLSACCGQPWGLHSNRTPDGKKHMMCAGTAAEALTHDDSRACGALPRRAVNSNNQRER
jgi:hypothetical protein